MDDDFCINPYTRLDSDHWYFSYYIDGKRYQKATPYKNNKNNLKDVLLYADTFVKRRANRTERMTWQELARDMWTPPSEWQKFRAVWKKPVSDARCREMLHAMERWIIPRFGEKYVDKVRLCDIQDAISNVDRSSSTKNALISSCRMMLDEAVRRNMIPVAPNVSTVTKINENERKVFSHEDLSRMFDLDRTVELWGSVEKMLFFAFLAQSGCRFGEALALQRGDIRTNGSVFITKTRHPNWKLGPTKNREPRVVFISKDLAMMIDAYIVDRDKKYGKDMKYGEYIFNKTYIPYRKGFMRAMKKLGLTGYVPHCFRHTYNTELSRMVMERKMTKEVQMALLGHKSVQVNRRYDHLTDDLCYISDQLSRYVADVPTNTLFAEKAS